MRVFCLLVAAALAACEPLIIHSDAGPDAGLDAGVDVGLDAAIDAGTSETRRLEVTITGDGTGRVASAPPGVDCIESCGASFALGEIVVVTASAAEQSRFVGWASPCAIETSCEVTLDQDRALVATFGRSEYELAIQIEGEGEGRVVASDDLDCAQSCSKSYSATRTVLLTARPLRHSTFAGWSGDGCTGLQESCNVAMDRARTISAQFDAPGGLRRFRSIEDLGVSSLATSSWAWAINDSGAVVGRVELPGGGRAFRIAAPGGPLVEFGTLGGDFSNAYAINGTGWMIGNTRDGAGNVRGFLCAPPPDTNLVDIGTLGGVETNASAINALNWIAGRSTNVNEIRRAFRRAPDGTMIDLGTVGGEASAALGINDDGWVVGDAERADANLRAFRVPPEPMRTMEELGTLGGLNSGARDINSSGAITGGADIAGGDSHAFYLAPPPATAMIDLGTLGGDSSLAYAINDVDQVVGIAKDSSDIYRPFIWDARSRVLVDLNELLPREATDWELLYAMNINNVGEVVGQARHSGQLRAFRLSP